MSSADRERWNLRWRERAAPGEPSSFLRSLDDLLPRVGRALDVAGGAGRHALWLARRGLAVTLVDVSDEALRIAREAAGDLPLETVLLDLDIDPLPAGPFDLVLCTFFLDRRVWAQMPSRLAPGGLAVVIHPTVENLQRHASPPRDRLVEPSEMAHLLPGLETLLVEESWSEEGRHEARYIGRRVP